MIVAAAGILLAAGWLAGPLAPWLGGAAEPDAEAESLSRQVQTQLERRLQARFFTPELYIEGERLASGLSLQAFYRARDFRPAWSDDAGPQVQAYNLLHAVQAADRDGLRPEDYHAEKIIKLLGKTGAPETSSEQEPGRAVQLASLELLLTDAYFSFATHALRGRAAEPEYIAGPGENAKPPDLESRLERALASQRVGASIQSLFPTLNRYRRLRLALKKYRELASQEAWAAIPEHPAMEMGTIDWRVLALRNKLRLLGDLSPAPAPDERLFDLGVEAAVKHFQARHGLPATGAPDEETWRRLNEPLAQVIRRLELNLERYRWLPRELGERYIWVNVPDFKLEWSEHGKTSLTMRVVVGQQYRQTPVFGNRMVSLVFNPVWEIPPDILIRDKLPLICRDPAYLQKFGITVLQGWADQAEPVDPSGVDWSRVPPEAFYQRYRFRQAPGPNNPLGGIKFMFPNPFNVYLHDTPSRGLFDQEVRDFSSGCIRIEKPLELALKILAGEGTAPWSEARVRGILETQQEFKVRLRHPVPIYILYFTAWVDPDGTVQFRRDLYGRDARLSRVLEETPAWP